MAEHDNHSKKVAFSYEGEIDPSKKRRSPRSGLLFKKLLSGFLFILFIIGFTVLSYGVISKFVKGEKNPVFRGKIAVSPTLVVKSTINKLSPEQTKTLQEFQTLYATASATVQGVIIKVDEKQESVEINKKIDGVVKPFRIHIPKQTVIFERPNKVTDPLNMLSFSDLTIGRYIVVSGKNGENGIDATIITADPVFSEGSTQPPKKTQ